jgi:S1-C subfamily serine protease
LFSISRGKSEDLKDSSEIFLEYHTAVVTVITNTNTGTGFSIETADQNNSVTGTEKKSRFVVTASHVVKGAYWVDLYIYHNEKDTEGNWKKDICSATVYGLDIVRDVALLEIACDKCNCSRLGAIQTRLSAVNEEKIFVIGNSGKTRPHSFIRGSLSSTNITFSPASLNYKLDNDIAATTFVSRVHGLTGSLNFGDAGSAVMANSGDVIGMILGRSGDHNFCVTMEEISKAYKQILNTISPSFVACTAYESALLGRRYWGDRSGKSIKEMNALATAMDAQYTLRSHTMRRKLMLLPSIFCGGKYCQKTILRNIHHSVTAKRIPSRTANFLSVEKMERTCVGVLEVHAEDWNTMRRDSARTTTVAGLYTNE